MRTFLVGLLVMLVPTAAFADHVNTNARFFVARPHLVAGGFYAPTVAVDVNPQAVGYVNQQVVQQVADPCVAPAPVAQEVVADPAPVCTVPAVQRLSLPDAGYAVQSTGLVQNVGYGVRAEVFRANVGHANVLVGAERVGHFRGGFVNNVVAAPVATVAPPVVVEAGFGRFGFRGLRGGFVRRAVRGAIAGAVLNAVAPPVVVAPTTGAVVVDPFFAGFRGIGGGFRAFGHRGRR